MYLEDATRISDGRPEPFPISDGHNGIKSILNDDIWNWEGRSKFSDGFEEFFTLFQIIPRDDE